MLPLSSLMLLLLLDSIRKSSIVQRTSSPGDHDHGDNDVSL
jgi:hypothetical protein